MEMFWKKNQRLKEEAKKLSNLREKQKRLDRLEKVGFEVLTFLKDVMAKNKFCTFELEHRVDNDNGKFTIALGSMASKLFQVDVDLDEELGKELHAFTYPDGPDRYWAVEKINVFKATISKEIAEFRPPS